MLDLNSSRREKGQKVADLPDRAELLRRLDEASGKGSVTATKVLLEELRRDLEDRPVGSEFDELDNVSPIRKSA